MILKTTKGVISTMKLDNVTEEKSGKVVLTQAESGTTLEIPVYVYPVGTQIPS